MATTLRWKVEGPLIMRYPYPYVSDPANGTGMEVTAGKHAINKRAAVLIREAVARNTITTTRQIIASDRKLS